MSSTLVTDSFPARRPSGWKEMAHALDERTRATAFLAGSLYGHPRGWLGLEGISLLSYDDPILYEEMIEHQTEFFMKLNGPILDETHFEFGYIFED